MPRSPRAKSIHSRRSTFGAIMTESEWAWANQVAAELGLSSGQFGRACILNAIQMMKLGVIRMEEGELKLNGFPATSARS